MAEYRNEALGARFTLPDRPSVRQQLAFYSEAGAIVRGPDLYERIWRGALTLMSDWECSALPDPHVDPETLTDQRAARVIMWAANVTLGHMNRLEELDPNS